MYDVDGDFGKVKLMTHSPSQMAQEVFFCVQAVGWHLCNEKYHIERQKMQGTYLLLITVSGQGYGEIGDRSFALMPQTVLILPPDTPIKYHTPAGGLWEFYWVHIGGESAFKMLEYCIANKGYYFNFFMVQEAADFVRSSIAIYKANETDQELQISEKLSVFLHKLLFPESKLKLKTRQKEMVEEMVQYMQNHYGEKITLAGLGHVLFISPTHLIRIFKEERDETPYDFLIRYRISKAKELLHYTSLSVREISNLVGYPIVSNFIAQFKKAEGISPKKYKSSCMRL